MKFYKTPLEDLKIGYICYVRNSFLIDVKGEWPKVLENNPTFNKSDDLFKQSEEANIFTKYIDQSDFEELGWQLKMHLPKDPEGAGNGWWLFRKSTYEIRWWGTSDHIEIFDYYYNKDLLKPTTCDREVNSKLYAIYEGTCRSINELITLQKLLKIN